MVLNGLKMNIKGKNILNRQVAQKFQHAVM